jgi:hypothetical protein
MFFSPDSSENPRNLESDFFMAGKERPKEAPFIGKKKHFLNERLQRIAGNSFKKNAFNLTVDEGNFLN